MFKGLGKMASLVKQAGKMRGQMQEMQEHIRLAQENLRRQKVEGSAGGGMVKVEMNGQQQLLACRIDSTLIKAKDREMLEDLVVGAVNQALEKSKELMADEMSKVTTGLDLSSLNDTLSQLGLDDMEEAEQ